MSKRGYYIGNHRTDAVGLNRNEWVMGIFMPENDPRHSPHIEMKSWIRRPQDPPEKSKYDDSINVTLIFGGEGFGEVEGKEMYVRTGDYLVVQPGIRVAFPTKVLKTIYGVTFKAPSNPGGKHVV